MGNTVFFMVFMGINKAEYLIQESLANGYSTDFISKL